MVNVDTTHQAAYILLDHLLSAPNLSRVYTDIRTGEDNPNPEARASTGKDKMSHRSGHVLQSDKQKAAYVSATDADTEWERQRVVDVARVCPSGLSLIQPSIFDMLRLIFVKVDTITNVQTYFLGVRLWLLYLKPWKAVGRHNRPPDHRRQEYTSEWDSYVSANFHFYTTLFSLFLDSVQIIELKTFDPVDLETFHKLFVEVLEIFKTKSKLRIRIDGLLENYLQFSENCHAPHRDYGFCKMIRSKDGIFLLDKESKKLPNYEAFDQNQKDNQFHMFSIFRQHRILFPERPNLDSPEIENYIKIWSEADDFRMVIQTNEPGLRYSFEEAKKAHYSNFSFEKLYDVIFGKSVTNFFENGVSVLMNICLRDYEALVVSSKQWKMAPIDTRGRSVSRVIDATDKLEFGSDQPERDIVTGKLTSNGIKQSKNGYRLNKLSIRFRGDPLDAPIMSNEW